MPTYVYELCEGDCKACGGTFEINRPIARDPQDHKLGGVIAGLSRTYGFDVRTTRIAVAIVENFVDFLGLAAGVAGATAEGGTGSGNCSGALLQAARNAAAAK